MELMAGVACIVPEAGVLWNNFRNRKVEFGAKQRPIDIMMKIKDLLQAMLFAFIYAVYENIILNSCYGIGLCNLQRQFTSSGKSR